MITIELFRTLAMALPETAEEPHFEKTSFRIKKKIFATIDKKNNRGVFKFNEIDQSVFSASSKMIFYPIPNKWGKQGWTFVDLAKVPIEMFREALTLSYNTVSQKKK